MLSGQTVCFHGPLDVLQRKRAKCLETQIYSTLDMVMHGARNAQPAGRACSFQSHGNVHAVAMEIGSVGESIADLDANSHIHCVSRAYCEFQFPDTALSFDGEFDRAEDAIECHQHPVAGGLYKLTTAAC